MTEKTPIDTPINCDLVSRIVPLTGDDLSWPFENGGPNLYTKPRDSRAWKDSLKVDPFPCYLHDRNLVATVAKQVESLFPLGAPPNYYLLSFEETSRTNGCASKSSIYADGGWKEHEPYIVLSGKRIPIHPAMTRYLVAHEYGHCVDYWINHKAGYEDIVVTQFDKDYAALRGIEPIGDYGALNWHKNIGEIIANDFRIAVCDIETEFWPHPGYAHPNDVPAVAEYWQSLIKEYAA